MIAFKELLVRAKRGEEKAFEELFEQFEPLVRKCSYMNGHTDEDLRQILLMEFVQAIATVYKGNIIKNLIMDCQSYTKYRPNETTGGIFVSWRRKEELPTGA